MINEMERQHSGLTDLTHKFSSACYVTVHATSDAEARRKATAEIIGQERILKTDQVGNHLWVVWLVVDKNTYR